MEVQENHQPEETVYKISEFNTEVISFDDLEPVTYKNGEIYLRKDTQIELLYHKNSDQIDKIFTISKNNFSVYQLSENKKSIEYLYSSHFEVPEELSEWTEELYFYLLEDTGDLIGAGNIPVRTENTNEEDENDQNEGLEPESKLRYFRLNLREAKKGEILKAKFLGEICSEKNFYNVASSIPLYPISLNNSYINSSVLYFTKYNYKGEKRPGNKSHSFMADAIRNKPDANGSYSRSVFEVFGWEFSSKFLKNKLEADKLKITDEEARTRIKFSFEDEGAFGMDSLNLNKNHRYYSMHMIKDHYLTLSVTDMRSKKVLKTTFISIYEIWKGLGFKTLSECKKLIECDIYYSIRLDRLLMVFNVQHNLDDGLGTTEEEEEEEEEEEQEDADGDEEVSIEEENEGTECGEEEDEDGSWDTVGDGNDDQADDEDEGDGGDDDGSWDTIDDDDDEVGGKKKKKYKKKKKNSQDEYDDDDSDEEEDSAEENENEDENLDLNQIENILGAEEIEDLEGIDIESVSDVSLGPRKLYKTVKVTMTNVFNHLKREITWKEINDNQITKTFDNSLINYTQERDTEIDFNFIDEDKDTTNTITLKKDSNNLSSGFSYFERVRKIDETKLLMSDTRRIHIVDLAEGKVLDRLQFCHYFDGYFHRVEVYDDIIMCYEEEKLILEFFKIEGSTLRFVTEVDLFASSGGIDLRINEIEDFLLFKRLQNGNILMSFHVDRYSEDDRTQIEYFMVTLEIDLKEGKIVKFSIINLAEVSVSGDYIELMLFDDNDIVCLDVGGEDIVINLLDKSYQLNTDVGTLKYTHKNWISNVIYKDFKLFVKSNTPTKDTLDLVKFDPENPQRKPVIIKTLNFQLELSLMVEYELYDLPSLQYIWMFEHERRNQGEDQVMGDVYSLRAYDYDLNPVLKLELDSDFVRLNSIHDYEWADLGRRPILPIKKGYVAFDLDRRTARKVKYGVDGQGDILSMRLNGDIIFYDQVLMMNKIDKVNPNNFKRLAAGM